MVLSQYVVRLHNSLLQVVGVLEVFVGSELEAHIAEFRNF